MLVFPLHWLPSVWLARHHVRRLGSLGSLLHVVGDALALLEGLESLHDDGAEVDEDVAAAVVLGDEAEALLLVEPLDGAGAGHGDGVDGGEVGEREEASVLESREIVQE